MKLLQGYKNNLRNRTWAASVTFCKKYPKAYSQVSFIEGYIVGDRARRRALAAREKL